MLVKEGVIESGDYSGQQIMVIDDADETRLHTVLISKDLNSDDEEVSFSLSLESKEELQEFFDQSNWLIRWLS